MRRKQFIISFLMFTVIAMVGVPLIPHHHHGSGTICMKDDIQKSDCACHHGNGRHHQSDDPCCSADCIAVFTSVLSVHPDEARPHHEYSITLFSEPLLRLLAQPRKRIPYHSDHIAPESLYSTILTRATGLRAPPATIRMR